MTFCYQFGSVAQSTLRLHGLQHSRLPCPSPTPEACSNACPSGCWCYRATSSSVLKLFFSLVQFSHSVMSGSLWPHESQHARPPCPSPTLEFTQTHVHQVSDAIQPSQPLLSPSPPAPNPFQHQDLFKWVSCLHEVAKVLEFQLQHQSFQWTPRTDLL